ncbi:MAG: agmatine deiminase family protein, partial [Pirellulaceae bacterium]|nr:agmatine deiminase family protein [Pirellulaceae bacterium]
MNIKYFLAGCFFLAALGTYLFLTRKPPIVVLPAEFELQEAILIAYEKQPSNQADQDLLEKQRLVLIDIIAECHTSVDIKVLVSDKESHDSAKNHLISRNIDLDNIEFIQQQFDSMWIRDYGPIQLNTSFGTREWLDFDYYLSGDSWVDDDSIRHGRPSDDNVIPHLAKKQDVEVRSVDIALHGGAILSNGGNILVISKAIFD